MTLLKLATNSCLIMVTKCIMTTYIRPTTGQWKKINLQMMTPAHMMQPFFNLLLIFNLIVY